MRPSDKDIFGDGYGFRAVSQGGPRSRNRVPITEEPVYRYNYDLSKIPQAKNHQFLGLYDLNGVKRSMIIWRAPKPIEGLRFLTHDGCDAPYYVNDPLAWAELPKI